ncbi:MAG: aminotransferase class I/II-fold pyridoxal phosphate-dependent enzyme [Clostridia bacterium]|nr:aminotransferase class I/II-fold pyridoxal phosphate-dependent enzyme [Clostridia bacterium]
MLYFENDYTEGACPEVLAALIRTNDEKLAPYGGDRYSLSAAGKIRAAFGCPDGEVFFLTGGTQTNRTVIASVLKPYEGVIAAETGHIACHEAGAVELSGHKVIAIPQENGKITASAVREYLERFYGDESHEHMVFPGMVYISHPTEYGTLYTKSELSALHEVCREYSIPLFVDGARLGYGLASSASDMTPVEFAANCDIFYIGGTKVGALCGEAVVFTQKNAPKHFMTIVKQNGAMLAKSRIVGVQFDALFTDGCYFRIAENAIRMADRLKKIFAEKGYRFFIDSPTNQLFVILGDEKLRELRKNVTVSVWEKYDADHTVVRFATSWATRDEDVDALAEIL